MGALYGILGDADPTELRALGNRLAHRGREAAEWSPGRDMLLGIRGTRGSVDAQEHGPVAFEGAIDNRGEIARLLRRRDAEAVGPTRDAGLVFELMDSFGSEGLARLAGQFAIAFWHGPDRRLLLARDRIGYAPLYFTTSRGCVVFASEYKALLALEGVAAKPNLDALQVIHATGWVSPGATCLEGIYPVAPGSYLEISAGRYSSRRYWSIPVGAAQGSEMDHATRVRESLLGALRLQTSPYGRIGISLSGGLDSALVAAGVRAVAEDREIHTFTAGQGPDDQELLRAGRLARALGTLHHPVVLDPDDLATLLPWMVWHLEEPVGRESVGYLFAAVREAARHVTFVVTGFGLDGLFAGLRRHRLADLAIRHPAWRRPLEELYDYVQRSVPPRSLPGRALRAACYRGRAWPAATVRGARPLLPFAGFPRDGAQPLTELLHRGFLQLPYQSPVERLYAGVGVRLGAQHTDPVFLATAFSIPDRLRISRGTRKYILRKSCASLLGPASLPTDRHATRPAHDLRMADALDRMAVELLSPSAVRDRGFFDPGYVAALVQRAPGRPYGEERMRRLWSLLLTEIWARSFLDRGGSPPDHPLPTLRRMEGAGSRADSAAGVSARAAAGRPGG